MRELGEGEKALPPMTLPPTKNDATDSTVKMTKVLMVFTSAAVTETGKPAGYYLPEAAHVCGFDSPSPVESDANPAVLHLFQSWLSHRFCLA